MRLVTTFTLLVGLLVSIGDLSAQADSKSKALINKMIKVTGNYDKLKKQKDVEFDYIYDNFDAGRDVSKERLIFDGEQSWASYTEHKRNVLPGQEGYVEQSLIAGKAQITLEGKFVTNPKAIGGTVFIREVNPFWFSMIYKLEDKGTNFKYIGSEVVDGVEYEKVSLTYDGAVTEKEANDEYILYFNNETHLVDLFYFSLPAMGVNQPVIKMTMAYEVINGLYIPTVRRSYAPNKDGEYTMNGEYTFKNVKFNNGFKTKDFVLKGK
ncbi:hypothetical protein N9B82_01375 [Saprospiraceae bacterium]|nr:hypothetical protein [Saprospiraceae bacterium]